MTGPGRPDPYGVGLVGKHRNWFTVWVVWPFLTLGIYHLVWYYRVNRESRDFAHTGVSPLGALLAYTLGALVIIPPFVSFWNTGKRIAAEQLAAGLTPTCSPLAGLLLQVFLLGSGTAYYQHQANKAWAHYPGAVPGQPVTVYRPVPVG